VTTGDEPRKAASGAEAGDGDDHAALVARVRDELEAARRRVRDAWAQYQERAADEHTREAVALSPLLTALLGLVS
jgi:hypothetical protein